VSADRALDIDPLDQLAERLARAAARERKRPVPRAGVLASYIDHTLLRPDATLAQVDRLCEEALAHGFAAVCVNGTHVKRCARALERSAVAVCAVAGFPLGACTTAVKRIETARALEDGADEVDVVLALGALLGGDESAVERELAALARDCHAAGARLKAILECGLLDERAKVRAAQIGRDAGCDFLKTSTGFAAGGATVADVELLRRTVGRSVSIKAAGGIRGGQFARALIAAGADRIGASRSIELAAEG
jgi:deoxyribose-phosphate aldolase